MDRETYNELLEFKKFISDCNRKCHIFTWPINAQLFAEILEKIFYSKNIYNFFVENRLRFGFSEKDIHDMSLFCNGRFSGDYWDRFYELDEMDSEDMPRKTRHWAAGIASFWGRFKLIEPSTTILEQAVEPIIWTGTKEQLAAAIDVFVQNGCIANENHWKIFSDHFVVKKKATNEPERLNPKQLSSIFSKTDPSRAKVKKLTDELSEGLKP